MRPLALPELQARLTESLIAFDRYCRRHDVRYSLCGGTLIGAVRHQGFIPWDDDTDVMMTRSEYRRLARVWREDPDPDYTLLTDDPNAPAYAAESGKWFANATAPLHPVNEFDIGLFMDIFVADGLPDDPAAAAAHLNRVHLMGKRFKSIYKRRRKPLFRLLQQLAPSYRPHRLYDRMMREIARYPDTQEQLAFVLGSSRDIKRETIPRHYFDHFVELSFEGHHFLAIAEYDAYLRHYYGDYMQLPPESERLSYHTRNHVLKQE